MGNLISDLRYGIRLLARNPGFTLVAVVALALGIGANTAIFSVVNGVLLRPLPFPDSGRLMSLYEVDQRHLGNSSSTSYPDFFDWRAQNHTFERLAAYHDSELTLTGLDQPAHLNTEMVSYDLFPLLGVSPVLGRGFLPEEEKAGSHVLIMSHEFWESRFGSDPKIVGRTLTLNNVNYSVVGVMPAGFNFPLNSGPASLWTTIAADAEAEGGDKPSTEQRGSHFLSVIGRLKPNVAPAQAAAEMDVIAQGIAKQFPDTNRTRGVTIRPELEDLVGDIRPALMVLFGAVGCVLLIACANVANLLLARATSRYKEIAIRASLGAGRWRVIRQLVSESILLSALGGGLGFLLALWGVDVLLKLSPDSIPRLGQVRLDGSVLAFTVLVSVLTGVIFGLVPAWQLTKSDFNQTLKEGGRSSTDGSHHNRLRNFLVIAETAISMILLVGAGLLITSYLRLQRVDPGFNPHQLLTFSFELSEAKYPYAQRINFYRQFLTRLQATPGIRSAASILPLPLSDSRISVSFEVEGRPVAKSDEPSAWFRVVSPKYFSTMGVQLLKGREFSERDDAQAPGVIIVNEEFARRFFPNEDVMGKHIKPGASGLGKAMMREVVGVVADVKHLGLGRPDTPEYYVPYAQCLFDPMTFVARTQGDPRGMLDAVRNNLHGLDKDLPVYAVRTMDDYLAASVAQPRFNTLLLGIFAGMALLLSAVGLYGVMAYTVGQRTHEIGIRMALGAEPHDVLKMVIGRGLGLTLAGVALGLVGAMALSRFLSGMLFGVLGRDPATLAGVSLVLLAVAALACYVPARRATRVDPMVALRHD
jgi:putative ABC transport system permease protein